MNTNAVSGITTTGATLNGTVNANNASTTVTFEYGLTTGYGTSVPAAESPVTGTTAIGVTTALSGLTSNTLYHFRVVGVNAGGTTNGSDLTFMTNAVPSTVTTNAASGVTTTAATLNGTINANGTSTTVTFEYGMTIAYGSTVTATESPVTGTTAADVTGDLSGLTPNTTYHFRAVGVNLGGTTNGSDRTFTTGLSAPTVTTEAVTLITETGATLNGTVNANNSSSTVTFEYGTTTSYGRTVTAAPNPVTGTTNSAVSAALTGLITNTTYHYRVVAVNGGGRVDGADLTFTTLGTTVTTVIHDATEAAITSGTIGMSVHGSATVAGSGGGPVPTGTVSFTSYNNPNCSGVGTSAGSLITLVGGEAHPGSTLAVPYSGLSFKATYSGDGNYLPGTGACTSLDTPPVVLNNGVMYNASVNPLTDFQVVSVGLNRFRVTFNSDVQNLPDTDPNYIDSVTNPANFMLVNSNGNGFDDSPIVTTCLTNINPNGGDDFKIPVDSVSYSNGAGTGPFVATLNINGGKSLANGTYRLYVCGTTSITDPTGLVELAGNGSTAGSDFIRNFSVSLARRGTGSGSESNIDNVRTLPATGFAPNQVTSLSDQPLDNVYSDMGDLMIEIPTLGVKTSVSGVPLLSQGWDLTWLNGQVGWLEGTAFPTWNGNTVLTAHAYTSDGLPGPFALLKDLKYGDTFTIHFNSQNYIYSVRTNNLVDAGDTSLLTRHEELDWVTLITCQQYDEKSKTYLYRWVVRAVLTDVQGDEQP